MLFAYFGPETFLPLTSVIAGVAGVFLMFGKNSVRVLKLVAGNLLAAIGLKKPEAPAAPPAPHVDPAGGALERRRARARANANAEAEEPHGE